MSDLEKFKITQDVQEQKVDEKAHAQTVDTHEEYLDELCSDLIDSFSSKKMSFKLNIRDVDMPLREAVYIGLIVNEAVTNSIKYSNAEKLLINIMMQKKIIP